MDYKSRRWKRLRESALAGGGWQCRECARYGRRTEARVAHHAFPAEQFPALAFAAWNLVPLCPACHNAMHVRAGEELTERGLALQRRVALRHASRGASGGSPPVMLP